MISARTDAKLWKAIKNVTFRFCLSSLFCRRFLTYFYLFPQAHFIMDMLEVFTSRVRLLAAGSRRRKNFSISKKTCLSSICKIPSSDDMGKYLGLSLYQ